MSRFNPARLTTYGEATRHALTGTDGRGHGRVVG